MGTAIQYAVPVRVKPSFVMFDIRALWRSAVSVRVPGCQKLQTTAWHRILYSCIHVATVGVKGLTRRDVLIAVQYHQPAFVHCWQTACVSTRLYSVCQSVLLQ